MKSLKEYIENQINSHPDSVHKIAVRLLAGEGNSVVIDLTDTSTDLHGNTFSAAFTNRVLALAAEQVTDVSFSLGDDIIIKTANNQSPQPAGME